VDLDQPICKPPPSQKLSPEQQTTNAANLKAKRTHPQITGSPTGSKPASGIVSDFPENKNPRPKLRH